MNMADRATQIIKQSMAYRAKYLVSEETKRITISPMSVVPHPKNRGGDPVVSLRTMQLNGTIAVEGYDPTEANGNGVAVQEKPALAGGLGRASRMTSPRNWRPTPTCWSVARALWQLQAACHTAI